MPNPPLRYGQYYHIYNRGNNSENLFLKEADYHRFLEKYQEYIPSIADTYAYAIMKNHFHFLVRIKEQKEIQPFPPPYPNLSESERPDSVGKKERPDSVGLEESVEFKKERPNGVGSGKKTDIESSPAPILSGPSDSDRLLPLRYPKPDRQFSHLFNAHARYFNLKTDRHGSLFERPFKRKIVDSENYLKELVIYIHNNPVHHNFTESIDDYPYTSYEYFFTGEDSFIDTKTVIDWFEDINNFKKMHFIKQTYTRFKKYIIE